YFWFIGYAGNHRQPVPETQPMSHPRPDAGPPPPPSLELTQGWHCSHLYYRFDRGVIAALSPDKLKAGREELIAILNPEGSGATARLQTSVVSGNKADFGLMLMDASPLKIEGVNQQLLASTLGPALIPTYSFISVTEISEYVPTIEQYSQRLKDEG